MRKFNHNVPRDVINELANNKYDIIIDPSLFDIPVHRLRLFRQIKAKSVLGFNKWPSIKHYSHSFDFDCQRWHVTKTFELIADYLQLDTRGLDAYDWQVPGPIMQEVAQYLASLSGKAVVINILPAMPTAVSRRRSWRNCSTNCWPAIRGTRLFCSITGARSASRCRRRW